MAHPYNDLTPEGFWRSAVADKSAFEIEGLWRPRFRLKKRSRVITAGSCFAQHFGRALVARRYKWIDAEPAPEYMTEAGKRDYQYGIFSFRTGNIYTPKMLDQWLSWATGTTTPPDVYWEKDGRFYDPFRPGIEKNGFATPKELYASRQVTIAAVKQAVKSAHTFVFTLGLTEAWQDAESGVEFAICPGTFAGTFDPEQHVFVNHGFSSTLSSLKSSLKLARKLNANLKFILTVSPVPLTATASAQHVLTASSHSKSVLRAVAGEIVDTQPSADYFPSYEIITHSVFRGMFFDPNMRSVTPSGVEFVMDHFFADQARMFSRKVTVQLPYGVTEDRILGPDQSIPRKTVSKEEAAEDSSEALLCEEEMLDAFSK